MRTTPIDPSSTLGELVTEHPGLARHLERQGLDYCCGGHRSLAEACAASGLDLAAVVDELTGLDGGEPEPWADLGPAELVDHIEATHHRYLHDELPRLTALADKVAGVHGGRHPEVVEVAATYAELRAELEPHLLKEERILFPMVRQLVAAQRSDGPAPAFHCGSLRNPISVMLVEHEHAGALLEHLRDLTDDHSPPADACASYQALYQGLAELEADTHRHVHKESNVLFPAVVALEEAVSAGAAR